MNRKEALKDIFIRRLDKDQLKDKWGPDYGKVQGIGMAGLAVVVALFMAPYMMWELGYFDEPNRNGRYMTADDIREKCYYDECMQKLKGKEGWTPSAAHDQCTVNAWKMLQNYKDSLAIAREKNATWEDYGQ